MIISLIAALTEKRVIGNKNRIPWRLRDDLIRFKQKTIGHTVIMGRTTFESIMAYYERSGRPIPDRKHIVVTRDKTYKITHPGCFLATSIDEAIEIAKKIEKEEVFVSGGATIFEQMIGKADRLYLTIIKQDFEGDTYFPDYSNFKKVRGKEDKVSPDGLAYTFLDLER